MTTPLRLSRRGLDLIAAFEGYVPEAQLRVDGRWVIGHGHTASAREGGRVSPEEARLLLRYDLRPIEDAIAASVRAPLTQGQVDALGAFAFNIGVPAFRGSDVVLHLNAGRPLAAAAALEAWRSARIGDRVQVVDALVRRRAAEKALFLDLPDGPMPVPTLDLQPLEDQDLAPPAWMDAEAEEAAALAPTDHEPAPPWDIPEETHPVSLAKNVAESPAEGATWSPAWRPLTLASPPPPPFDAAPGAAPSVDEDAPALADPEPAAPEPPPPEPEAPASAAPEPSAPVEVSPLEAELAPEPPFAPPAPTLLDVPPAPEAPAPVAAPSPSALAERIVKIVPEVTAPPEAAQPAPTLNAAPLAAADLAPPPSGVVDDTLPWSGQVEVAPPPAPQSLLAPVVLAIAGLGAAAFGVAQLWIDRAVEIPHVERAGWMTLAVAGGLALAVGLYTGLRRAGVGGRS